MTGGRAAIGGDDAIDRVFGGLDELIKPVILRLQFLQVGFERRVEALKLLEVGAQLLQLHLVRIRVRLHVALVLRPDRMHPALQLLVLETRRTRALP